MARWDIARSEQEDAVWDSALASQVASRRLCLNP